ncbi:MAG TPA: sigma-70 family RNA polymerase sigma factor [Gemmataceae bacterium]|jgi:RNA polymerase sigma factor (sigma-70 family)|nr:sigma-70 family RNA polymerase sigma factor [Gemmataceae bacterium]
MLVVKESLENRCAVWHSAGQHNSVVQDGRIGLCASSTRSAVMAADSETLLRYIRRLVSRPEPDGSSDGALLGRFISEKDEQAFAALVDRHGPLVLQVCRRVLVNVHDAEDAFQAAFLVLARKAATVRPREALPAWLHGVAHRVALKARSAKVRRLRKSQPLDAPPADPRPDPLAELSAREMFSIVDEELRRLPEIYRLPVILCCLQGRSQEEAARQLGWTPGSVRGRLERGRARLHDRLVRRGLTLSAALAAAEVSRGAASAAVVAGLVAPTVRAAMAFAARQTAAGGVSVEAVALAGEAVKCMSLAKLRIAVGLALATCLLAAGFLANRAAQSPSTTAPPVWSSPLSSKRKMALAAPAAIARNGPEASRDEPSARYEVRGRVLDPGGKPFAGAKLYVGYSARRYAPGSSSRPTVYTREATSAADGRFHFAFAKSELDDRLLDAARPAVAAVAAGFGPDWVDIGEATEGAELNLRLVEDLALAGHILDQNRKPVAGAKLSVVDITSDSGEGVPRFLQGDSSSWSPQTWRGPFPGQPPGVTTDADGRFRLTGLGRDRIVALRLEGSGIQDTLLVAATRHSTATPYVAGILGASFDYVAPACRPIRGVVRDKTTGKPVAGVRITTQLTNSTALTEEDGSYKLFGCSKSPGYDVAAQPQTGQPYFAASAEVPDKPGHEPIAVDFALVGGIRLRGRVTDHATRKPPKTAVVEYYPLFPNPHSHKITNPIGMAASSGLVQPDGSYSLVVLAGPGVVCVGACPRDSYAVAMLDSKLFVSLFSGLKDSTNRFHNARNQGGGQNPRTAVGKAGQGVLCVNRYNTLSLIKPEDSVESLTLDLTLQPARALRGTVVGPRGKPLTGVRLVGLTAMPDEEVLASASFTVSGLNPGGTRDLFFYHRRKGLGKFLTIRGDETKPLTVQLDPCGTVIGRIVDRRGKAVTGVAIGLACSPGWYGGCAEASTETDLRGRFCVAGLLPGQKYSLTQYSSGRLLRGVGEIEVQSGRSKNLGELVLDH